MEYVSSGMGLKVTRNGVDGDYSLLDINRRPNSLHVNNTHYYVLSLRSNRWNVVLPMETYRGCSACINA